MVICFFTKHQMDWGSSRHRVGLYLDYLKERGHTCRNIHVIPNRLSRIAFGEEGGSSLLRGMRVFWYWRILKNLKLLRLILFAGRFDVIFIQKLSLPFPLVWLLGRRNKNLIFDFDDQCFWDLESATEKKPGWKKRFRFWYRGVQHPGILRLYHWVIAGNRYLAEIAIAMKGNQNVVVIPTAVNCRLYHPPNGERSRSAIIIGWSGSGENHLRHLQLLVEPLKSLERERDFIFKLVGAMNSKKIKQMFAFLGARFVCLDWVDSREFPQVIRTFDIGVMPLVDDDQARAKCGFKTLEYMASGVAALVSPVGINQEIVEEGINGLTARSEREWREKLSLLIADAGLRNRLAGEARKTVERSFSLDRTSKLLLDVLERKESLN